MPDTLDELFSEPLFSETITSAPLYGVIPVLPNIAYWRFHGTHPDLVVSACRGGFTVTVLCLLNVTRSIHKSEYVLIGDDY